MNKNLFLLIAALLLTTACGHSTQPAALAADSTQAISTHQNAPGDSALYGLACDGCTDSILVLLPYAGGDPDTFDITRATAARRVFGRPHIGDELAVIVNPDNRAEALIVINTKELSGDWCYMVSPRPRPYDGPAATSPQQLLRGMPDSVRRELTKAREYTLRLKGDNTAMALGAPRRQSTSDEESPMVYPPLKRYTDWHLFNGQIILKADTISGFTAEGQLPESDTATIRLLMRDSLVLQFGDHQQAYYRKRG